MSQITSDVVVDCIMEGFRRKLQALSTPYTLPSVSIPARGGKPPYGLMRQGGVWVLNPAEIYAAAFAQMWYKEGLTLKQIGRKLARHGYHSRGGGVYSTASVFKQLLKK